MKMVMQRICRSVPLLLYTVHVQVPFFLSYLNYSYLYFLALYSSNCSTVIIYCNKIAKCFFVITISFFFSRFFCQLPFYKRRLRKIQFYPRHNSFVQYIVGAYCNEYYPTVHFAIGSVPFESGYIHFLRVGAHCPKARAWT